MSSKQEPWKHDHSFGQERVRVGERRTLIVIVITVIAMVVEVVGGIVFGSVALLADGLHMASHVLALGVTAIAYRYTRMHADDERYSFGAGKFNAIGGFVSAIILALFSVGIAWKSIDRWSHV